MDYIAELAAIAKEHGGIIETKIAAQHGISKAMLYKMCKEDKIHRIVKGQYILPDDMDDELLSISKRSTQIICASSGRTKVSSKNRDQFFPFRIICLHSESVT